MAVYGYGIVDKDGRPWWGEDWCVCEDKHILEEECANLNDGLSNPPDERRPYRVVQLSFRKIKGN